MAPWRAGGAVARLRDTFHGDTPGVRLARGAVWSVLGFIGSQGANLLTSVVIARMMGKSGFGEYGMVTSTVGTFGVFAGAGLGVTATRHVAQYRKAEPARAGAVLRLSIRAALVSGVLASAALYLLAPVVAADVISAGHLVTALRAGCLLLLFSTLGGAQTGALSGLERFRAIAGLNVLRGLLGLPLSLLLLWYYGLTGAVVGIGLANACACLAGEFVLHRECRLAGIAVSGHRIRDEIPLLWRFSLPAFLSGALIGPVMWLANTLIARQQNGYAELGLVNAASQWRMLIMTVPGLISTAALPILSAQTEARQDPADSRRVLEMVHAAALMVALPLSVAIMFVADIIMSWYGKEFTGTPAVLVGFAFGTAASAMGTSLATVIVARGRVWFGLAQNLLWAVVLLGIIYYLAPQLGALSYALGYAVSYFLLLLWSCWALRSVLPPRFLSRTACAMGCLLLMTALALMLPATPRLFVALPAVALTTWLCVFPLTPPELRAQVLARLLRKSTT